MSIEYPFYLLVRGQGGQGVTFLAEVLLRAATHEGKYGEMNTSYEYKIRGGIVQANLVLAQEPVKLSQAKHAQAAVILHPNAQIESIPEVTTETLLLEAYTDNIPHKVMHMGFPRGLNMYMLGALLQRLPLCSEERIAWALKQMLGPDKIRYINQNLDLLEKGGKA